MMMTKIARELGKIFPNEIRTVRVKMKYGKAVARFIRKVEAAHRCTAKSRQIFKGVMA